MLNKEPTWWLADPGNAGVQLRGLEPSPSSVSWGVIAFLLLPISHLYTLNSIQYRTLCLTPLTHYNLA